MELNKILLFIFLSLFFSHINFAAETSVGPSPKPSIGSSSKLSEFKVSIELLKSPMPNSQKKKKYFYELDYTKGICKYSRGTSEIVNKEICINFFNRFQSQIRSRTIIGDTYFENSSVAIVKAWWNSQYWSRYLYVEKQRECDQFGKCSMPKMNPIFPIYEYIVNLVPF